MSVLNPPEMTAALFECCEGHQLSAAFFTK